MNLPLTFFFFVLYMRSLENIFQAIIKKCDVLETYIIRKCRYQFDNPTERHEFIQVRKILSQYYNFFYIAEVLLT